MASEPLVQACEVAFEVARRGWEANPPVEPPAPMRSFIYLPQLPRRAMTVAQRVMDEDPEFRARVAAFATEARVGRAGYLWLQRPQGWEATYSMLAGGAAVAAAPVAAPAPVPPAVSPAAPPPPPPPASARKDLDPRPPAPVPRPQPIPPAPSKQRPAAPSPSAADAVRSQPIAPEPVVPESIQAELANLRSLVSDLTDERAAIVSTGLTGAVPRASDQPSAKEKDSPQHGFAQPQVEHRQIEDLARERDAARRTQSDLEDRLVSLEAELRQAKTALEEMQSQHRAMEEALRVADEEVDRSRALIDELRNQREEAERALSGALAERDALIDGESALKDELDEMMAERDAALGRLEQTSSERESWLAERDGLKTELSSLRSDQAGLREQLRRVDDGRATLEAELADVSGKWQRLQSEAASLNLSNAELEQELDQMRRVRESANAERRALFDDLAAQLGRVEAERDLLASQLELANARLHGTRSALESATRSVNDEFDSCEHAFGETTQAVAAVNAAVTEATRRLDLLAGAMDSGAPEASLPGLTIEGSTPGRPATETDDESNEIDGAGMLDLDVERYEPSSFDPVEFAQTEFGQTESGSWVPDAPLPKPLWANDSSWGHRELRDDGVNPDDPFASASAQFASSSDLDTVLASYGLGVADLPAGGSAPRREDPVSADPVSADPVSSDPVSSDPVSTDTAPIAASAADAPIRATVPAVPADKGVRSQVAPISGDPLAVARHTVVTQDVVLLIDGDPAADMGWPMLDHKARRDALVGNLGDLVGDTGAAVDVVFSGRVAGDEALPSAPAVRVRLTNSDLEPSDAISDLVDAYPLQWPVAVVTDNPALAAMARSRGAAVLDSGQLLDLFIAA